MGIDELGDLADAILNRISDADPKTDSAIELPMSLDGVFNGEPFSARELWQVMRHGRDSTGEHLALWEAVTSYFHSG